MGGEMTGSVIISKSTLHGGVTSPFTAEALGLLSSSSIGQEHETNQLAHTIASESLKKGVEVYLVGALPDFVGISQGLGTHQEFESD
ncbi:hypothetical protein Golax_019460 [Gossypium laxum]|uniref:Uncharacterized protein n=1 Tax=Gossypium laxum TaxID=34288 RepID=A0A7J8Z6G5_9ROSI|nr:hypothetical protein [Gossypium laxum]